jgi:hypothetical protein
MKVMKRLALAAAMVLGLAAATSAIGATSVVGASPNPDNSVSALAAPTPLPHGETFERLGGGQPPWTGAPVLFNNLATVDVEDAGYPGEAGPCASGPAYLCPPESQVQGFEAGGSFLHPAWKVPLGKDGEGLPLTASAPVWNDGSEFVATDDENCIACQTMVAPVLVRLNVDGKVVSRRTLSLPPAIAALGSGRDDVQLYPTAGGLLLWQAGAPENGQAAASDFVLEKIGLSGNVEWSAPGGTVVWYQGSVILIQGYHGDFEARSAASGKLLWTSGVVTGTTTPDVGVSPPTRNAPDGVEIFSRSPLRAKDFALTDVTARNIEDGHILWQRDFRDLAWPPDGFPGLVFSGPNLVVCQSIGAVDKESVALPRCGEYNSANGAPVRSLTVPNAKPGSAVQPIAASPTYLLVEVYVRAHACDPLAPASCGPSGKAFSEAVSWSTGKAVGTLAGGASEQWTYNFAGGGAITVTGATSGWRWPTA